MIKVGIVGATGYTGGELLRLLLGHKLVRVTVLSANVEGTVSVNVEFPQLSGLCDLEVEKRGWQEVAEEADLIFLALPHRISLDFVPHFLAAGKKVIDLSADYRLKEAAAYEKWYGAVHSSQELLQEAVYGLPELWREEIVRAQLVANPGCYPTSVILALAPLLANNLANTGTIIVDSKSAVSGAGRWPGYKLTYTQCAENMYGYRIASHQHQPEMEQELSKLAGHEVKILFTPHLVPMNRGILSTCYVDLKEKKDREGIISLYSQFYQGKPFVRVLPEGCFPEVRSVRGSNYCDIGIEIDERTGRVIIISAIDNLMKGAAGQAVQNMNLICGYNEEEGLSFPGLIP